MAITATHYRLIQPATPTRRARYEVTCPCGTTFHTSAPTVHTKCADCDHEDHRQWRISQGLPVTRCAHGYDWSDSCPGCDADQEDN